MITADTAFELSESIRQLLQMGSAMSAHNLAEYFHTDSKMVEHALQILLSSGRVEALRPVGKGNPFGPSVYYRWKKDQDDLHVWQRLLWRRRHTRRPSLRHLANAPA